MPDLETLVRLFYSSPDQLGRFAEVTAEELPPVYRGLLAHRNHMTVTVEAFHRSPVDVQVLETRLADTHYARKILLRRQSDRRVVQFGIMRIDFSILTPDVRREIESEQIPLGRVLIQHKVLRKIHLTALWKVSPGSDLQALFEIPGMTTVYGRTALIDCNGQPGVELLEIVTPEE